MSDEWPGCFRRYFVTAAIKAERPTVRKDKGGRQRNKPVFLAKLYYFSGHLYLTCGEYGDLWCC